MKAYWQFVPFQSLPTGLVHGKHRVDMGKLLCEAKVQRSSKE